MLNKRMEKIKQLRNEYSDSDFLIEHLDKNPIQQFTNWLDDAIETKIYEPNAMVLATSVDDQPRSRYVLFKNIVEDNFLPCLIHNFLKKHFHQSHFLY